MRNTCDSSFTAQTPLVKKGCYISEQTKAEVVIKSAEAQSITSIACGFLGSPRTVQCITTKESELSYTEYKYYLLFGQRLEISIVEEMLNYNDELKANYILYQHLYVP